MLLFVKKKKTKLYYFGYKNESSDESKNLKREKDIK